jgi:sialic acid synthase SpsE/sugar phosphate isomerase/epimerase
LIITKKVDPYIVHQDLSVQSALQRLDESRKQILFVVDSSGKLIGVVTDGDIRRWLLKQSLPDLAIPIKLIAPSKYLSANVGSSPNDIQILFGKGIHHIPLVDRDGVLCAVALSKSSFISIGGKEVGLGKPTYVIAEIGNNHQGSLDHAKSLIEMAASAGVDSVKFQMRSMSFLYGEMSAKKSTSQDLGAQYTADLLSRFQLSDDELYNAFDHCKAYGVEPICTPWDLESVKKLQSYGMAAYKVASADFTNDELLTELAATNTPLICSTGMCSEDEILSSSTLLKSLGAECILLHCNSTYPTPFKDVNLNYLVTLKKYGFDVGYSGHERGNFIPLAAMALGACVIEKHITFDKAQEGNDHKVSLLPEELEEMVSQIRLSQEALGNDNPRSITQGEMMNREVLAKSLFAKRKILAGEKISRDLIEVKSPGQGLQPNKINSLVGRIASRDIEADTCFFYSDLDKKVIKKEKYNFKRPYGIPVRYHDFERLTSQGYLDFAEFHLSYQDLNENPSNFITTQPKLSLAIHAPELFQNDHILDLCSLNPDYRRTSIEHLNNVIAHCKELTACFKEQQPPILVVNAGGWDTEGFVSLEKKDLFYEALKKSLKEINDDSVSIAFQTMPPFPWHFGGQSHHNLFVDPDEIAKFCTETDQKICLDVSHSMMACNYYGWDLNEFVHKISKHISYLHIVDAEGSDGEGVQLGEGDVNFEALAEILNNECPKVPFIPEVWQGHKDSGAGFWSALNFLEQYF